MTQRTIAIIAISISYIILMNFESSHEVLLIIKLTSDQDEHYFVDKGLAIFNL
jgi:hypothetical protein